MGKINDYLTVRSFAKEESERTQNKTKKKKKKKMKKSFPTR